MRGIGHALIEFDGRRRRDRRRRFGRGLLGLATPRTFGLNEFLEARGALALRVVLLAWFARLPAR